MKLHSYVFLISILLLLTLPAEAKAESFSIDQAEIRTLILDNGDIYTEELYTYSFDGSFNGTTRTIGDDDHGGVEFFEGYLAPDDAKLETINPQSLQTLKVERDDLTYKIHTASKNETKKVFYRYRIKDAVSKYGDTGQFYWRFFDEMNENDIHNLRIQIALYNDSSALNKGYAFLHDLTGGSMKKSRQDGILYENKLLPAGKTAEIRFLFPETYLKNAVYTENTAKLAEFLAEEEQYQQKRESRKDWINPLDTVNSIITLILLIFLIYLVIYPRRLYRWFNKGTSPEKLKHKDSFLLAAIYRKGRLRHFDIISALFRMQQKGFLSMERVTARPAYLEDEKAPDHTYLFTVISENKGLTEYEQKLIDWLFTPDETGRKTFSLDQLPFPTAQEKKSNWRMEDEYKRMEKEFNKAFKVWRKTVLKDTEIKEYVRLNLIRESFLKWGIPIWILMSLFNAYIGMSDLFDLASILALLTIGWAMVLIQKKNRLALPIYFGLGSVFAAAIAYEMPEDFFPLNILLFLVSVFLPISDITFKGAPYHKAIREFRNSIKTGRFHFQDSDKWIQHALSLDLFTELNLHYAGKFTEDAKTFSALLLSSADAKVFSYTNHYYHQTYYTSSGSSGSGSSGGSGGGGGAGAF
ncbi:hypothetical protein BK139_19525 [Paenibacillus sp. FSL R5-0490]|uniref:DUF2207 domain-containing protein n=1 Tax=Bacillales TaxID=1385 RepID=UPI00096FACB4|nr:DUF2207 domain-containing protein [Paenibacillus sp. FSL R5-0490]OMF54033.1 hypothetical protein BK139_19525 [Paenibacillus sp. FSL R5-0490]